MRKVLFILGQLSDTDTAWLASHGRPAKIAAGTELIRQGTSIDTIYIVLDGTMSVLLKSGIKLGEVGSGDILGELSLVDSGLTTASVRVDRDSTVLAVPKSVLQCKLDEDAHFAAHFYRAIALSLAHRMRNTTRHLGYESDEPPAPTETDELDPSVLDTIHLAGARFERILSQFAGE